MLVAGESGGALWRWRRDTGLLYVSSCCRLQQQGTYGTTCGSLWQVLLRVCRVLDLILNTDLLWIRPQQEAARSAGRTRGRGPQFITIEERMTVGERRGSHKISTVYPDKSAWDQIGYYAHAVLNICKAKTKKSAGLLIFKQRVVKFANPVPASLKHKECLSLLVALDPHFIRIPPSTIHPTLYNTCEQARRPHPASRGEIVIHCRDSLGLS